MMMRDYDDIDYDDMNLIVKEFDEIYEDIRYDIFK